MKLLSPIEDLFFPPRCLVCDTRHTGARLRHGVCAACWAGCQAVGPSICARCGCSLSSSEPGKLYKPYECGDCRARKRIPFTTMRSVFRYESPVRELIRLYKFESRHQIGAELTSHLISGVQQTRSLYDNVDILVPVPLHLFRLLQRGFNQSEQIAAALSDLLGVPVSGSALRRVRNTRPQSRLHKTDRQSNLRNAFAADPARVNGKTILLVDDVITTGTTIESCCRELRRAGAAAVSVLSLARAETT